MLAADKNLHFISFLEYDKTVRPKTLFSVLKVFFLVLIFICFASVKNANAGFNCTVSPISADSGANIIIDGNGNLSETQQYYVSLNGVKIGKVQSKAKVILGTLFSAPGGKITLTLSKSISGNVIIGIYLRQDSSTNLCNNNPAITITSTIAASGSESCNVVPVSPDPFEPKPTDYIGFKITGNLTNIGKGEDQLHAYIKLNNNDGATIWDGCIKRSDLSGDAGFGFGYLTTGNYFIGVNNGCTPGHALELQRCVAYFNVDPLGGGLGGAGNKDNPIPPGPCANGANSNGICTKVDTGLGVAIVTNPKSIVQSIFGIILSLSGGIALFLIILSGYKLLVSQGNPEAVKGAREQLTAAIVGLVFIVLSLVILQIIGVDILHIPGFS